MSSMALILVLGTLLLSRSAMLVDTTDSGKLKHHINYNEVIF